ncbi:DUF2116 family Zn-ribbon domain-containing protein [Candidatus Pacearchaeota archaeon]|nr:DUF2116 family Zn-ribbon domain-containing protein [Candidatus Pacearchaeota archaeon]
MKQEMDCPLCEIKLISKAGLGCMMCGMPIDEGEFCSMRCEEMYEGVNGK